MKKVKVRDTSMRAFLQIKDGKASDRQRVFNVILATGDEGLTSKEAELRTKLPHESASARANELLRDGFLVRTGTERLNPSGQPAEILIVPKSVRNGEQAVPPPKEPVVRFTVQTDAHPGERMSQDTPGGTGQVAWLMLGTFCVARYTDSENGNANISANAVAFHLNRTFGLTEKIR